MQVGVAATIGVVLAPLLLSSERYRSLVAAAMAVAVIVKLLLVMRRVWSGYRAAYPPSWSNAQRRLIKTCQATMAIVAIVAWGTMLRAAYGADYLFSQGAMAEFLANHLFAACVATFALLAIVGPRNYEDRDLVRIPLWIALVALLVVFVQQASVGRY